MAQTGTRSKSEGKLPAEPASFADWQDANQTHLLEALTHVRSLLEARLSNAQDEKLPPPATFETLPGTSLHSIVKAFHLTPFERDLLLLCAGIELDSEFARLCVALQGNPTHNYPTFSLALSALPGAYWAALMPASPLRANRLIEVVGETGAAPLTTCPLRVDEWCLHFLAGALYGDARLPGSLLARSADDPVARTPSLRSHRYGSIPLAASESQSQQADEIVRMWRFAASRREVPPVVQLLGDSPLEKVSVARKAAYSLGLRLRLVSAGELPTTSSDRDRFLTLWEREMRLTPTALYIEFDGEDSGAAQDAAEGGGGTPDSARQKDILERLGGPVFVASPDRIALRGSTLILEIARPSSAEQEALWLSTLASSNLPAEPKSAVAQATELRKITSQFNLGASQIHAVVREASAVCDANTLDGADLFQLIWNTCRRQSRQDMESLAQRIDVNARWDDLVLPQVQKHLIESLVAQATNRGKVYEEWGVRGKGTGVTALFSGASGTGKTMAAEVIAGALNLDLYRVDLSSVVSKYIGETEKNLRRLFSAAESGGAILLFDEADSLFGKRSEVKDSHDRHANIEVAYLLQRMESYRGLAILTTNLKSSLDIAFYRRLRLVIEFPFPDAEQRQAIWERAFTPQTPTYGLNSTRLAQLNFSGGSIRNCAINAAFLAAQHDTPVTMGHVLTAARAECAKLERRLTDAETTGWEIGN